MIGEGNAVREGRTTLLIRNIKVGTILYVVSLFIGFYSRKIFLDCLGVSFIGLTTTLQNMLGFVNLAECGIGAAAGYALFGSIAEGNRNKIATVVKATKQLYNKIGILIFVAGVVMSFILPWLTGDSMNILSEGLCYSVYYLFLGSMAVDYVVNYRQLLLLSDQRNYVVTVVTQGLSVVKTVSQIFLAINTGNLYLWLLVEGLFIVMQSILLNISVSRYYPWLKSEMRKIGNVDTYQKRIKTDCKRLAIHKVGEFLHYQTTPLIVCMYLSMEDVAVLGNYTMITTKVAVMLGVVLSSMGSGIGNLIASGDIEHTRKVWNEVLAMRLVIGGYCALMFFLFMNPLISIWIGTEYVLPSRVSLILALTAYIGLLRRGVEQFLTGFGLFSDIGAPLAEGILDVAGAMLFGCFYGLPGILAGSLISNMVIVVGWKPYYLFRYGMKQSLGCFWNTFGLSTLIVLLPLGLALLFDSLNIVPSIDGLIEMMVAFVMVSLGYCIIVLPVIVLISSGGKDLVWRIQRLIQSTGIFTNVSRILWRR